LTNEEADSGHLQKKLEKRLNGVLQDVRFTFRTEEDDCIEGYESDYDDDNAADLRVDSDEYVENSDEE
jgi:hypothetical protein